MKKSRYYVLIDFISYKEILLFFLFFVLLMIVLFPKGRLEELLSSEEETNIDLSKKYLEALIRTKSPEHLRKTLLSKFARIGNEKEVRKVIETVKKENPKLALEVEYNLLKREYFLQKGNKESVRREIKKVLTALILLEDNPKELEKWFRESVSMNFPDLAYKASKKLAYLTKTPMWYEKAFLYAIYSGNYDDAKRYIGKFKPSKRETYLPLYYFLIQDHKYKEALNLLEEYIRKYPEERERVERELMIVYFLSGNIKKGEKILNKLIQKGKEKKVIIITSIRKLMEIGAYQEVKRMIKNYLHLFRGDKKLLTELLKLSLQTGDPRFAAQIAEEILREE